METKLREVIAEFERAAAHQRALADESWDMLGVARRLAQARVYELAARRLRAVIDEPPAICAECKFCRKERNRWPGAVGLVALSQNDWYCGGPPVEPAQAPVTGFRRSRLLCREVNDGYCLYFAKA